MSIRRNTLSSYPQVKPYRQGSLSAFCGLYAAFNAARLICPEWAQDSTLWTDTYHFAVSKLSGDRKLKRCLMDGLGYEAWKTLQHAIYDRLSDQLGCSLRMRPLVRRPRLKAVDPVNALRSAIDADRPVLCAICGIHDHYTVISGYTPSRWLLHDSAGMRWIEVKSTAIGPPDNRRHWIPYTSLVVLYRAETHR